MRQSSRIAILIALCLAALCASAQAPQKTPITGNVGSILGTPSPYAAMYVELFNCASPVTVQGYSGLVQTAATIQADSYGNVNSTLWPNDVITCNGTIGTSQYGITYIINGIPSGQPVCYQILSTQGVFNLNAPPSPVACGTTPPNPTSGTYGNLNSTGFFQGNNGSFTGTLALGGVNIAATGIFSGLAYNTTSSFIAGTVSPSSLWATQQLGLGGAQEGVTGAVGAPSNSTLHQINAVAGYALTNAPSTMGVGGYFTGTANAAGTSAWGINPVAEDIPGLGGNQYLWGDETDCNLFSVNTRVWCFNVTGRWGRQPSGTGNDQAIAMKINQPIDNTLNPAWQWNIGLNIDNASTQGPAIQIGARQASGINVLSQYISFFGFDGSGSAFNTTLGVDGQQRWQFGFGNLSTNSFTMSPAGNFTAPGIVQGATVAAVATGIDQDSSMTNYEPALLAGHYIATGVGANSSNFNHADFGFNYTGGSGSASNIAFLAVRGGPEFTVDGSGNATVNGNAAVTGSTTVQNLTVNGTCTGCLAGAGTNTYTSVTGCAPALSTDSSCAGTITISAQADASYFPQLTINSPSGALLYVMVSGTLTTTSIPYTVTCTFNCGTITAPTIYVYVHHN